MKVNSQEKIDLKDQNILYIYNLIRDACKINNEEVRLNFISNPILDELIDYAAPYLK
jgi:hypothetical protein